MPLPTGYKYDYKKSVGARKIENAVPKEVFAKVRKLWLQGLGYAKVAEQVDLNPNQIETIIGRLKTKNIKGVKRITQKDIQNIESELRYTTDGKAYKIIKGKTIMQVSPALETAANEAVELFKDYEKIKVYPSSIWNDLVKKHKVNRSSLSQLFKEKTNYDLRKDFTKTYDKKFVKAAVDYSKLTDEQKKKFGTKAKILNKVLGKESTLRDRQRLWRITSDAGIDVKEELPPSKYKQEERPRIIKKQSSPLIEGTLGSGKGMSKKVIDVSAKKGSLLDLMHLSGKTSPIKVGELGFGPRAINQLLGGRLAGPKETRGKGNLPEPERYRNQLERHMEKIAQNYKNKAYYRIQTTPGSIDQRLFKNVLQRLFGKTSGKIPLKEYLDKVVNEEARLFGQTTEGLIPVQLLDPDTLTKTLPIGRDPTTTIGYGTEIETEPLKGLEKEYRKEGWRKIAAEKASGEMGPTTQKFATLEAEAQNKFLYTLLNSQKNIHTDQNKIKAVARNIEEMAKQGFINAADEDFNNIRNLATQCSKLRLASAGGGRIGMAQGDPCGGVIKAIKELPPEKYAVAAEKLPEMSFVQKIFSKIPKGGRLGMAVATLGAVGAGTYAMMGGAKAEEAPTTDQMTYNSTTGEFDNAEGDPETQEGILNWIADHPVYSGLAPIPIGIGAGLGADAMKAEKVGKFFKSMKFILPPAYAAEKLHQYKRGDDMGQMFANPIDAVWAMALDTKDSAGRKMDYYTKAAQKAAGYSGVTKAQVEAQQLGLRHLDPRRYKETGAALKRATMAPRSFGTSLVFPFAGPKAGAGAAMKVFRGAARLAPLGPLPMALLAGSMAWDKYKFNKEVGNKVDALRARGIVSEEDAQSMNTIYKQGWLGTTAIGAKILGSEELMLDGELADIEKQKEVLAKMKEYYEGREEKGKEFRAGERQEDFFDWFSKGGRVGMDKGGSPFHVTRRGFLKWLVGSIAAGVAAVSGKGIKQAAKTATATVAKTPAKFIGVEGMPAWFPRAVAKIKAHGKLISMADKDYVQGDMYEMMIPVTRKYLDATKRVEPTPSNPRGEVWTTKTEMEKVIMEDNPLNGEIGMQWTGTDNFGGDAVRQINFKPGQAGYQKFGVDDAEAASRGVTEYQRVKVEEPEFSYTQPDQSQPYRDDIEYLDIFEEGDEIVKGLEDMTGSKQMVTKDGTVIDVSAEGKKVDELFQKKIYKDIEGEEAIIPEPEGVGVTKEGDVYGEEGYQEIIGGEIPDHLKKKAGGGRVGYAGGAIAGAMVKGGRWFIKTLQRSIDEMASGKNAAFNNLPEADKIEFYNQTNLMIAKIKEGAPIPESVLQDIRKDPQFKSVSQARSPLDPDLFEMEEALLEYGKKHAEGGLIETGNIARRPGAVPPLSGPTPQGRGILGLFSSPKRVNIT